MSDLSYENNITQLGETSPSTGSIILYPKNIKHAMEQYKSKVKPSEKQLKNAISTQTGITLLHELLHHQQYNSDLLNKHNPLAVPMNHIEAYPQAIFEQINLETMNPINHSFIGASKTEIERYKTGVGYDPIKKTIKTKKADEYCKRAIQERAQSWAGELGQRQFQTHASINTQLMYGIKNHLTQIAFRMPKGTPKDQGKMNTYLKDRAGVQGPTAYSLPPKLQMILMKQWLPLDRKITQLVKQNNLQPEQEIKIRLHVIEAILTPGTEILNIYRGTPFFEDMRKLHSTIQDLDKSTQEIASLSQKIHDGDQEALKKATELRTKLLNDYGLNINPYNIFGERTCEMTTIRKEHTLASVSERSSAPETQERGSDLLRVNSHPQTPISQPDKSRTV